MTEINQEIHYSPRNPELYTIKYDHRFVQQDFLKEFRI